MVDKTTPFTRTDMKTIERVISNENLDINHMVLGNGDALPEHNANSHVQMIVVRGTIPLRLDDQDPHDYPAGHIVSNTHDPIAEIFVVKAPAPASMS